jgi:hypothetical protein
VFFTNPSAIQQDFLFFDDEKLDRDYDSVWEVRTQVDGTGWTVEYRIPFSQMRFDVAPAARTVWGLGFRRTIHRRGETGEWTGRPRGERGEVSRWGHLVFDEPLEPPRRVELLPYSLARAERLSGLKETGGGAAAGFDARVGVGSAFTLSATVNPDFGQVEQDPAVLNLTVFETFFPEKRPFFLEDSRTFVPPQQLFQLFHSRRIGRRPDRLLVPSSDVVNDRPDQTTILGAAKLTGKASGWTFGAMSAATADEYADVNVNQRRLVEPLTSYNIARVQRDVRGSSNIGALATAAIRDGTTDAYTGGVDYNIRWDRNRWFWDGTWAVTRAAGAASDPASGFGGLMNFGVTRKHVSFSTSFDHLSPTFRVTDLGFLRNRVNRTQVGGRFNLDRPDPGNVFRRIGNVVTTSQAWNDQELVFTRWISNNLSMQFLSFWTLDTGVEYNFQTLDDLDTRGGPPIVRPPNTFFFVQSGTDTRKRWRLTMGANIRRDTEGGHSGAVTAGLSLQPSPRLQASFSARYDRGKDIAQWILNRDVTGDGLVDHVYGTLDRDVVDLTMRGTYAIHRDLTFQFYLQPFVAAGDYTDLRRLARPRSFSFEPVSLPTNPDFNTKSLRSNVVLRWEYLRGSTLYLVYNVATSDASRPGTFSAFRDLGTAFGAEGSHVFMVKASYWFSR